MTALTMAEPIKRPALQEELLQQASDMEAMLSHYAVDTTSFLKIIDEAEYFTVRVPLVGAFSGGKTSLINALLGKKYFAVEVNPETSLPVELSSGNEVTFTGHRKDGNTVEYSQEEVLQQSYDAILPDGWLEARLPAEHLSHFPYLTLVDMPGWDSGIAEHSKAIDAYINRSLAYAIVVSADEGTLRDSIRNFLRELAHRKMQALLIVTKTDKKPVEDIEEVAAKLEGEVSSVLGQPPLAVAVVSARKKNIAEFTDSLASLHEKVDECFHQSVLLPLAGVLKQLAIRLEQLSNNDDLKAEEIQFKKESLRQDAEQFQQRLKLQEQQLDRDLQQGIDRVISHIRAQLQKNKSDFAHDLIYGSGLENNIMIQVRLALAESMDKEFSENVARYLQNVANDIPQDISINGQFNADIDGFKISEDASNTFTTMLISMLPALIPGVGLPAKMLGVVSVLLADVARNFFSNTNKKLEAARRQEAAEDQICDQCIPKVMIQVEALLRQQIQQQSRVLKSRVAEEANDYLQQNQQTLDELELQLHQGKEAFKKVRQVYLNDLETVKQWMNAFANRKAVQ